MKLNSPVFALISKLLTPPPYSSSNSDNSLTANKNLFDFERVKKEGFSAFPIDERGESFPSLELKPRE